jgi:hypothetical protein
MEAKGDTLLKRLAGLFRLRQMPSAYQLLKIPLTKTDGANCNEADKKYV